MAVIPMTKIKLAIHESDKKSTIACLQNFGLFEFSQLSANKTLKKKENIHFKDNHKASTLDFAVNFLSKWLDKDIIQSAIEGSREPFKAQDIKTIAKTFKYEEIIAQTISLEEGFNHLAIRIESLRENIFLLESWRDYPLPLNLSLMTKQTISKLLRVGPKAEKDVLTTLTSKKIIYSYQEYGLQNASLTFLAKDQKEVEKILKQFEIEEINLPYRSGDVKTAISAMEEEVENCLREKEEVIKDIKKLTIHLPTLKALADWYYWRKKRNNILNQLVGTDRTVILQGWCPTKKIAKLKRNLKKITDNFALSIINKPQDNPPVEIENKYWLKPFESITRLYGLPNHNDLDPTIFLAGFFFLFFGVCLTDVFYGLFLAGVILLFFKLYKIPKDIKPLLWLILLGGVSSSLVGIFFGGYLGFSTENLPGFLTKLQIFNPLENPLPVFYFSLALGVIQIIFGLILKIVHQYKNNNLIDGILDQGPWLYTFVILGIYLLNMFNVITWLPDDLAIYFLASGPLLLIITQGRKEKGIIKKILMGVLSLYDSVGYFSDMLSYSRLLALGLSTSALAFSVNMIAFMVKDIIPGVGWIFFILVLVVGHLFNLVVNVLGAFVHSARLQFVEFFGKFITGTGRNFKPFRREERNVIIIQ